MGTPRVLVLRAPGTNCDQETAFAFEQVGGCAEVQHVFALREHPERIKEFQVLCIPGGFSYGDDLSAGRLFALELEKYLQEALREFIERGGLVLGICNGFQTLLKSGLLSDAGSASPEATLTWNHHGRYEDRWVHLHVDSDRTVFLRGIESLYLPIAHAEGRFVARDAQTLDRLEGEGRLSLRYAAPPGTQVETAEGGNVLPFPFNPNGSQKNVAGVCDATGHVFGLMPHPERHIDAVQHPRWTRSDAECLACGRAIFENAITYFT